MRAKRIPLTPRGRAQCFMKRARTRRPQLLGGVPQRRGGHSYSTRRTVRDRGQDAVKRSSRIFSTGQAVKRTFWVGQRSRPTFAQTNSYSNSYPTGYTHDFVYTVYLSRLTSQLPAHALVQTGLTFHPFWNRTPSFIMYGL